MKKISLLFVVLILFVLQSCNTTTPEQYFDRTTLNTNTISSFGKRDFIDYLNFDKNGKNLKTRSCVEHVQSKINFLETDLKKIENLKVTEDTKTMIEASLALFTNVDSLYKTEYLQLAKHIDDGASKEEIMQAISSLELKYNPHLIKQYQILKDAAIPYAEKNDIVVKFQ